ncbi:VOC family protein [Hyalangium versicolor]|uniref:VOC family protein n=1 Tax=Hyalangium versicolor TaxID=2861190 RepID=UPI001CCBAA0C|nr:VOC family protein [Hyalangium versicolor]
MPLKKGRFVWYDLMTTDAAAAKAFYTEIIGWKTQRWEQAGYEMWAVGEQTVGGMMALPDEAKKMGARPHWLAYIETDDVDATVKKAEQLGGKVHHPPTDIPTVGRFATLADPQGASFAVFKPTESGPDAPQKAGFFSWHELYTTDYKAAWKFYSELFGWKNTRSMDMGEDMGEYWMYGLDSQNSMGGMSNVAKQQNTPPYWLYYVTVDDIDATVARIQKRGGKLLNGPMEVPGGDRIAQCMDPQGAMFAVHMPARK